MAAESIVARLDLNGAFVLGFRRQIRVQYGLSLSSAGCLKCTRAAINRKIASKEVLNSLFTSKSAVQILNECIAFFLAVCLDLRVCQHYATCIQSNFSQQIKAAFFHFVYISTVRNCMKRIENSHVQLPMRRLHLFRRLQDECSAASRRHFAARDADHRKIVRRLARSFLM